MVLKFNYLSNAPHFAKRLEAIALKSGVHFRVRQKRDIYIEVDDYEAFAKVADELLYSSIFFEGLEVVSELEGQEVANVALSIGLCQNCINEMLDPASRRYYYPFTSCASCSNQYAFFAEYPFTRQNTLLAAIKPCAKCQEELKSNPLRRAYPLISCVECNIPLVIQNFQKEYWANEKEEYKRAFEIAANALRDGKSVAIKTLNGWKRFTLKPTPNSKLLVCNLEKAKQKLLFLKQELQALFSIERPKIFATLADEELKKTLGAIVEVKAFDDGFTFLLVNELKEQPFIFYEEHSKADFVMEYFLETNRLQESHLFLNKHHRFIAQGERFVIPQSVACDKSVVHEEYLLHDGILDKIERFSEVKTQEIVAFEEGIVEHSNVTIKEFGAAALFSVIKEHGLEGKVVEVHFSDQKRFYYFDGKKSKEIFDFGAIPNNLQEAIANHREGSDRLLERFFSKFEADIQKGDFWQRAAAIIGIEGGFDELNKLAMNFGGKGGLSVDCRIDESRFLYESFYASLMSYRLAGVDSTTLAYSLFESLGDFLSNALRDVAAEIGVQQFIVAGKYIANTVLFSRFIRNLPTTKTNQALPIDTINGIIGVCD